MVDKTEIDETQVVMLSVAVSGSQQYSEPDWTLLEDDFHLAATTQQRESVEIVNGRVRRFLSWEVYLIPKRLGNLTVPSFQFGNEKTEPITIVVKELDPELKKQIEENVFFETTVEPQSPYVQAAIHVTRRLYYSNNVQVRPEQFVPLSINDTLVVEIGDVKRSFSVRGDNRHNVLIRRSVVFAERSGDLTIPATQLMVRVSLGTRDVTLPIFSKPKTLRVLSIPRDYPDDHNWFPASDVRVTDSLATADLDGLSVGDSIVRQIEITAIDAHSTGIPQVDLNMHDSVRRYPDPPQLSDSALIDSVVGKRTQSETLLLTSAGTIEIPQTDVIWWSPEEKQVMRTTIDKQVINVASGLLEDDAESQAVGANVPLGTGRESGSLASSRFVLPPWQIIVYLCVFLVIVAILAYTVSARRLRLFARDSKEPSISSIQRSLKSKNPGEVKSTMVGWLCVHLQVSRVDALEVLSSDAEARRVLDHLNESIYADRPYIPNFNGHELRKILARIVKNEKNIEISSESFLGLYERMSSGSNSAS